MKMSIVASNIRMHPYRTGGLRYLHCRPCHCEKWHWECALHHSLFLKVIADVVLILPQNLWSSPTSTIFSTFHYSFYYLVQSFLLVHTHTDSLLIKSQCLTFALFWWAQCLSLNAYGYKRSELSVCGGQPFLSFGLLKHQLVFHAICVSTSYLPHTCPQSNKYNQNQISFYSQVCPTNVIPDSHLLPTYLFSSHQHSSAGRCSPKFLFLLTITNTTSLPLILSSIREIGFCKCTRLLIPMSCESFNNWIPKL